MTREEALALVTFKHCCTCGSCSAGRRDHAIYCPQKQESDEWYEVLGEEGMLEWEESQGVTEYPFKRDAKMRCAAVELRRRVKAQPTQKPTPPVSATPGDPPTPSAPG